MFVVIPARYASTRLPGKPLVDIAGKPMILRTLEAAASAAPRAQIFAAVDDARVADVVRAAGFQAVMTDPDLPSGTDRCATVAAHMGWGDDEIIVNVQGDEPALPASLINMVAGLLVDHTEAQISTLGTPMGAGEITDPNKVKLVADADGRALYFSRAPIPFDRDQIGYAALAPVRHIGLYAYRVGALQRLAHAPVCALEQLEKLEQLRALYLGYHIQTQLIDTAPPHGVDTQADLAVITQHFLETE